MIIDIISFLAIGSALGVIIYIVGRRLPEIASIEVGGLEEARNAITRHTILESKLKRKIELNKKRLLFVLSLLSPAVVKVRGYSASFVSKLWDLERRYREELRHVALPDSLEKLQTKVHDLLQDAGEALENDEYDDAEKIYIDVIKYDAKNLFAYWGLLDVYKRRKEWSSALDTLQYIVKMDSGNAEAYAMMGEILRQKGDIKEAKDALSHSLTIDNSNPSYHAQLGEVYVVLDETDKAISSYTQALSLSPNNPKYLDALLELAIKVKNKDLAKEMLAKIEQVNPENQKLEEWRARVAQW